MTAAQQHHAEIRQAFVGKLYAAVERGDYERAAGWLKRVADSNMCRPADSTDPADDAIARELARNADAEWEALHG